MPNKISRFQKKGVGINAFFVAIPCTKNKTKQGLAFEFKAGYFC